MMHGNYDTTNHLLQLTVLVMTPVAVGPIGIMELLALKAYLVSFCTTGRCTRTCNHVVLCGYLDLLMFVAVMKIMQSLHVYGTYA